MGNINFLLIGITGRAGAGKTTAAKYIESIHSLHRLSFASLLKKIAEELYPWFTDDQLYGQTKDIIDTKLGKSPRRVLQLLGTEVGRLIWEDTWIDAVRRDIQKLRDDGAVGAVIDDVRFLNEMQMVNELDGTLWVIKRPLIDNNPIAPIHSSESYEDVIDKYNHITIPNGDSIQELYYTIDSLFRLRV